MDPRTPPSPAQPGGPKVFGVLSIIFASLTIFSSLLGGCSLAMTRSSGKTAALGVLSAGLSGNSAVAASAYQRYYDAIFIPSLAQGALVLALAILLLFLGIGQLRYRRWARVGSQVWGAAGLGAVLVMLLLSHLVFRPAVQELMVGLTRGLQAGSVEAAVMGWTTSLMGGSGMMALIFYLPYPLLLLIYFSRASIRAAMTAEG